MSESVSRRVQYDAPSPERNQTALEKHFKIILCGALQPSRQEWVGMQKIYSYFLKDDGFISSALVLGKIQGCGGHAKACHTTFVDAG